MLNRTNTLVNTNGTRTLANLVGLNNGLNLAIRHAHPQQRIQGKSMRPRDLKEMGYPAPFAGCPSSERSPGSTPEASWPSAPTFRFEVAGVVVAEVPPVLWPVVVDDRRARTGRTTGFSLGRADAVKAARDRDLGPDARFFAASGG
jgi:hypothetical protein